MANSQSPLCWEQAAKKDAVVCDQFGAPSSPSIKFLGTYRFKKLRGALYYIYVSTVRHATIKFNMVIKSEEENFSGSTTPLPWTKILVTRMLTRDLFAVANLICIRIISATLM